MDDLRSQLTALDHIAVPDQWPEIKRRSWAPATPAASPRIRWIGTGSHPQRRTSPMLTPVRVLAVGLVAALSTSVLAVSLSGPSADPAGVSGAPGVSPGAPAAVAATVAVPTPVAVPSPASEQPIDWDTGCVQLTAAWLRIYPDTAGDDPSQNFTVQDPVMLSSDPGSDTYRTLEATWQEGGSEMRLFLYFAADDDSWWVRELRTYDGQPTPDWITYPGPLFEAPLGQPYGGDVMLESSQGNVPGRLEIRGMTLSAPDFGPGTGPATCTQTTPVGSIDFGTAEASPTTGPAASPPAVGKTLDGMAPAVASAVAAISDELLEGCYTRDEAVARLSDALIEPGESGFFVRTDGPIGGPNDRIDEIMAHVDAGCVVYGGSGATEDGTPVFYVGGGSGGPTSTFVPGTASE
jgi:hypothetical protein